MPMHTHRSGTDVLRGICFKVPNARRGTERGASIVREVGTVKRREKLLDWTDKSDLSDRSGPAVDGLRRHHAAKPDR